MRRAQGLLYLLIAAALLLGPVVYAMGPPLALAILAFACGVTAMIVRGVGLLVRG
jgi:hypothetical protein